MCAVDAQQVGLGQKVGVERGGGAQTRARVVVVVRRGWQGWQWWHVEVDVEGGQRLRAIQRHSWL